MGGEGDGKERRERGKKRAGGGGGGEKGYNVEEVTDKSQAERPQPLPRPSQRRILG